MTPVLVASERGEVDLASGMALLRAGASAMDAVEAAIRVVESNEADDCVGVGGLPNLLGEVELDASVRAGAPRRAGAVAAVTGFPHPISIARAVCDLLPQHLLLVGAGAERFADKAGIERGPTLTADAQQMWRGGAGAGLFADKAGIGRGPTRTADAQQMWRDGLSAPGLEEAGARYGPGEVNYRRTVRERIAVLPPPGGPWGTVNVLALDAAGNLAAGVSTSGYPWKYPGRVSDSALIGAGNYCDNRVGAAACTGRGELAIRGGTARSVLHRLAAGDDPAAACAAALAQTPDPPHEVRTPPA